MRKIFSIVCVVLIWALLLISLAFVLAKANSAEIISTTTVRTESTSVTTWSPNPNQATWRSSVGTGYSSAVNQPIPASRLPDLPPRSRTLIHIPGLYHKETTEGGSSSYYRAVDPRTGKEGIVSHTSTYKTEYVEKKKLQVVVPLLGQSGTDTGRESSRPKDMMPHTQPSRVEWPARK